MIRTGAGAAGALALALALSGCAGEPADTASTPERSAPTSQTPEKPGRTSSTPVASAPPGVTAPVSPGGTADASSQPGSRLSEPTAPAPSTKQSKPRRLLRGITVVVDPGHQLGNSRFPAETNALVDAGGLRKACNTTGTATNAGFPEATMTWEVAGRLKQALEERGAQVVLTRDSNSTHEWGPCVDERGRAGAEGDLMVSLHGDGNTSTGAHGFHVIVPGGGASPADRSATLGADLRDGLVASGLQTSTYIGADNGVMTRNDLGTLNLSSRPVAMVELGNMRDAADAQLLTSPQGQRQIVRGLVEGIVAFVSA